MGSTPFLAVAERALADGGFVRALLRDAAGALAGAGFHLAADDLAAVCTLAAAAGGRPEALVQSLVALARQRDA